MQHGHLFLGAHAFFCFAASLDIMTLSEIRKSGLLELYLLGHLNEEENLIVQKALFQFPELEEDLDEIEQTLIQYSEKISPPPPPNLVPIIMATIDYTERLENGEIPNSPPVLTHRSTVADFKEWLTRPDMVPPKEFEEMFVKIIAHEPEKLTALIWLKNGAPDEIHRDEYEKFLIVEGTCNITIGDKVHHLLPGDFLSIPLHINHRVTVTSSIPCKIILQRIAA